jgi:hypothetical protein
MEQAQLTSQPQIIFSKMSEETSSILALQHAKPEGAVFTNLQII